MSRFDDRNEALAHLAAAHSALVALGMPADCADVAAWVASESTAAKAAHAAARTTRHASVAGMLWAHCEAVEALYALHRRAASVVERCGRAEATRDGNE